MIVIATDAWTPQVNGVVTTYKQIVKHLDKCFMITPDNFKTISCPGYNEIKLSLIAPFAIDRILSKVDFTHIHIATEGPIGWAVRNYCLRKNIKFTTSYHTKFPEFIQAMFGVPADLVYPLFKKFHQKSSGVMVATESIRDELADKGFNNLVMWSKGVDTELFRPVERPDNVKKILLYVGRVSKEKNIEAFLDIDVPNTRKIIIGDGPDRKRLMGQYSHKAYFIGKKTGEDLAYYYNLADVFVFPSKSDTFGLVMLEALACGTPVAAFPVTGPKDIIYDDIGCTSDILEDAIIKAMNCDRDKCHQFAKQFSWEQTTRKFEQIISEI